MPNARQIQSYTDILIVGAGIGAKAAMDLSEPGAGWC